MYLLFPIFYVVNGIVTHQYLQSYSPVYKTTEPAIQHDLLGRWTNSFLQVFFSAAILLNTTPQTVDALFDLFATYLITDMIHMLFYCYDWVFYLHHSIPLILYYTLWDSLSIETKMATAFTAGILELTTPPISLGWSLGKLKINGWYSPYVTAFAYVNFFVFRIVYFPWIWYNTLPLGIQIITLPYHGMNLVWFRKLSSYVLKRYV
jgi:hypothetical protein